jgi:hypothetical protein
MTADDAKLLLVWYLEAQDNQISEPAFSEWIQTFASTKDRGIIRRVLVEDAAAWMTIIKRAAPASSILSAAKSECRAEGAEG